MNISGKRILLIGLVAIILLGGAFSGGVFVGWFLPKLSNWSSYHHQRSYANSINRPGECPK